MALSIFEDRPDLRGALYMTMGNEGGATLAGAWSLTGILETSAPRSLRWEWAHMPDEDHGSVAHRSLYNGLEWLFSGWHQPNRIALAMSEGGGGWPEIIKHFSTFSERFGYEVRVPEGFVNQVGYALLQEGRADDAIRAFEVNVEQHPTSANVYDSLGDGYDAACMWEEARDSYAAAFERALEGPDPNAFTFKANLDRMTSQIESGAQCTSAGTGLVAR
jgi:tetratricopeptide (TPR) repeat protein